MLAGSSTRHTYWERPILKKIGTYVWPEAPLLLVAVALLAWPGARVWLHDFAPAYPAVYVVGALQCWRFQRTRLLFAMIVLVMADRVLLHFALGIDAVIPPGSVVLSAVALLLPLNMLALAVVPERGPFTLTGLVQWTAIFVQPALVIQLVRSGETLPHLLDVTLVDPSYFGFLRIPQLALLAFVIAFVVLVSQLIWEPSEEKRAMPWALIAAFFAVNVGEGGLDSTTYCATGGLMLVQAVIDVSFRLAYQDALTALPTRRGFNEMLGQLVGHYTVAMVDVDHFKQFNDRHGHEVGDQVLKMVAAELMKVGGGGKAFRYGGEEFGIIFDGKRVEDCQPHLEKLRATIAGRVFTIRGAFRPRKKPDEPKQSKKPRKTLKITVSIGGADSTDPKETVEDVVKAADQCLYRAKETGRNKVWVRARPRI
ncbi:MAG: GGDEF domain-containing protein [Gemmatimonadota bacterium]|nr:MAG: GGDEF domain-containing protein [Gemmatimonadota bacterium]